LGERLLCKQEVVGSIPSGSTSGDAIDWNLVRKKINSRTRRVPFGDARVPRVVWHREEEIVPSERRTAARPADARAAPTSYVRWRKPSDIFESVKLDRLTVGAILKQSWSF
jgi:hypothetical protein